MIRTTLGALALMLTPAVASAGAPPAAYPSTGGTAAYGYGTSFGSGVHRSPPVYGGGYFGRPSRPGAYGRPLPAYSQDLERGGTYGARRYDRSAPAGDSGSAYSSGTPRYTGQYRTGYTGQYSNGYTGYYGPRSAPEPRYCRYVTGFGQVC